MQLKDIEQGTSEWHAFRKGGIGSSDITILLGSNPFKRTALTLFEDKTSELIDLDDSPAMAYGRGEESKSLDSLRQKDPKLGPACAVHDEYDFVRCSFDALGKETFYEIKSPYSLEVLQRSLTGNLEAYWQDQVRWQLFISGFKKANLAVWDGSQNHIFEIEKDAEWEQKALQVAQDFWGLVRTGQRPEASDGDYIEVDDPDCSAYIQEYHALCEKEKELKKCKDVLKSHILDKGPGHNFMVDGVKIYQTQNASYDLKKMKEDGINLEVYKKVSHPYWMITPKRGDSKRA